MILPFVSREAYDERGRQIVWLQAFVAEQVAEMAKLRRDGFAVPTKAKVHEPPDLDTEALARAEYQALGRADDLAFIQRYAKQLVERTGCSEADALKEARRVRLEEKWEQPPA